MESLKDVELQNKSVAGTADNIYSEKIIVTATGTLAPFEKYEFCDIAQWNFHFDKKEQAHSKRNRMEI